MFDGLQGADTPARADDATVVAAISGWARAEATASARRLAAIAELVRRRAAGPVHYAHWSCDNWDARVSLSSSSTVGSSCGTNIGPLLCQKSTLVLPGAPWV